MTSPAQPPPLITYALKQLTAAVDASRMYDAVTSLLSNDVLTEAQAEYSVRYWKQTPSTRDVLFSLQLPLRPPPSWLGAFLWRKRLWVETTFALSMLQSWEKFFVWMGVYALVILFTVLSSYVVSDMYHGLVARIGPYLLQGTAVGSI